MSTIERPNIDVMKLASQAVRDDVAKIEAAEERDEKIWSDPEVWSTFRLVCSSKEVLRLIAYTEALEQRIKHMQNVVEKAISLGMAQSQVCDEIFKILGVYGDEFTVEDAIARAKELILAEEQYIALRRATEAAGAVADKSKFEQKA